ncbi:CopY/TcrY family copper transport repressor [Vagococcus acidifermentans]|uniref:Penicillinase repressor n=1 Tax=Vagococcus acidifermentans TaxID=564710 RepID=A0A430B0T9_9ENTE|nr:CopY/TcrY family copper transport repressor [Vagococcus acidifermentans]RSU13935.1 penicillinase repressor [Vagococcus acidifermentans]
MSAQEMTISEAEWRVMRIVWSLGEVSSQQMISYLSEETDWKPATIKTFLGRLVKKEYLATTKEGNKYIYHARISENEANKNVAHELASRICARKMGRTIGQIIEAVTLSFDDIEKLEAILEQKKKTAVEEVACNCLPDNCRCHERKEEE